MLFFAYLCKILNAGLNSKTMNMRLFKRWEKQVVATIGLLLVPVLLHAQWDFEDAPTFTAGNLSYAYKQGVAECRGLAEGQTATTVTVPATVTYSGQTYSVVSISGGAFLRSSVVEAHLLSSELQMGQLVFSGTIERLYLSASVPPALDYYLAVDPATFTFPVVHIYVPQGSSEAYMANEWWAQHIILDGDGEKQVSVTTSRGGMLKETLQGQLMNYRSVNHLTVNGPLNDEDIQLIRDSLTNLLSLDMSGAIIRKLPKEAFRGCRFKSIQLPGTLRDMGNTAFGNCPFIEELVIPEGVENVDNMVSLCPKLQRIDLPSTVLSAQRVLSAYSFDEAQTYSCTITCRALFPPKAGSYAVFTYGTTDIKLRVPAISASAYASAAGWKDLSQETISDLPAQIAVVGKRELSTDNLPADYRPNIGLVQFGSYGSYGANDAFGLLRVTGSKPLNVETFSAFTDLYSDRNYNGRYGCELLNDAPLSAQRIRLDLNMSEDWWYFLSFPFDVKVSDITTDPDIEHWIIRSYSGANRAAMRGEQWLDVPYSGTLEARRGYIWQVTTGKVSDYGRSNLRVSFEATGNTINNMFAREDVSIPLSDFSSTYEHNAGWNLVGNPYPCYYRIGGLKQTMPITVWEGRYAYEQYRTYSPIDDANRELHPYEAFFVQKPAGTAALIFGAEGRQAFNSNNTRTDIRVPSSSPAGENERRLINLTLTADVGSDLQTLTDYTRVVLNPEAKAGYERERDAAKFFSQSEQVPQLYTFIGSESCAINERPEADGTVRLGVRTGSEQRCTISLDDRLTESLLLEDRTTGILTDLTTGSYTFTSRAGRDDSRFVLYVGAAATGISQLQPTKLIPQTTFNLQGQPVSDNYKGIVIERSAEGHLQGKNGKLIIKR